jgi:hypothetical protein
MSTTEISIKQLPAITEINNNDLILVQTPTATNTLKFSNFVVGLENTTFSTTICANSTNIDYISSVIDSTFFDLSNDLADGPDLLTNDTDSTTLSSFDTEALPITITAGGTKKVYYFLLSAGHTIV